MRTSGPGKSVYLEIGIWYDEQQEAIHITAKDIPDFHTTVRRKPESKRGHPNLFDKLSKCLRDNDAPAPELVPQDL